MIKLLLHESKRRVGSPGVFITPGTYFIYYALTWEPNSAIPYLFSKLVSKVLFSVCIKNNFYLHIF